MNNLNTYNRVPALESQLTRRVLSVAYALLLLGAGFGLASYLLLPKPWPYTLLGSATLLIVCLVVTNLHSHSPKRCRYCGSTLSYAIRPFLLTEKYLSMEGRKSGNYFYTQTKPKKQRPPAGNGNGAQNPQPNRVGWVKLSNQSLACHHCRLTEDKYRVVQEIASPDEIAALYTGTQ